MDLGLAGRIGVLTGADGEIGRATARLLRAEGAKVLLVGRDAAALADLAEGLDADDEELATLPLEPTEPDAGEQILGAASEEFDRIDLLVSIPEAAPADDLRAAYELAVMAPMRAMKAVAPVLAESGGGRIVNVCPEAGTVAGAAALALSRLFADRYARDGVLVNAVSRGPAAAPEASAREIAFLCSGRASHVAGATWTVGTAAGAID